MASGIPRVLDLKRVESWVVINFGLALLAPLTVAGRCVYVNYEATHRGFVPPISGSTWVGIFIGVFSLYAALAYNQCNIRYGKLFGTIVSIGGAMNYLVGSIQVVLHPSGIATTLLGVFVNLGCIWFFLMQLRFVWFYYGKVRATDA
jgi:hypothetical protein